METVRLWLQEDQNSQKFDRIVFCGEDNLPKVEATLEKYFPLLPFVTGIIPEGVEGETPSADELLGEVPGENLMEGKTADQGGPERGNPNEKEVEREIPGDGSDGDKGGNDFDEEKVQVTRADKPAVQETVVTKPVVQETVATKPVVQETVATKPVVQETGATKPVVQETGATKPAVQETVAAKPAVQETGATKPVVQETVATKPAVQETGATKPPVEEVIDLDAITLELDNLQRAPQESLVELTVSQTSRDLDTLEKVTQEKLAELGGSEANEELDALDQVIQQLMVEAARLSPLHSEPTRLSPLPSQHTRLSSQPKSFTTLPLPPSPLRMKRSPSDSLLPNPERTESDV